MAAVSNGSVDIHYEDHGGDGRPVVLIHAWPVSGPPGRARCRRARTPGTAW